MCAMDHFHLFALLHDVTINFLDFMQFCDCNDWNILSLNNNRRHALSGGDVHRLPACCGT